MPTEVTRPYSATYTGAVPYITARCLIDITVIGFETSGGWTLLGHIQSLIARLLGANILILPENNPRKTKLARFTEIVFRRRIGNEIGLLLAPSPAHLQSLYAVPDWRHRFRFLAAYVFDSWYTEWYSVETRFFDCIFVSRIEDIDPVRARTGRPVYYAPFATDVMEAASHIGNRTRAIDLLAYGRQPQTYNYKILEHYASQAGLALQIRVPYDDNPNRNQHNLFSAAGCAKYALAFCNTVHYIEGFPPISPFITFRWVDNLAAGAIMVGLLPKPLGYQEVVGWEGAYFDLPDNIEKGFEIIADQKQTYNSLTSLKNHYESLIRNDWRIRMRQMFESMGLPITDSLKAELLRHAQYRAEVEVRMKQ